MSDQHEWSIFTGGGKRCMKILRNTDAVMGAILLVAPEDPGAQARVNFATGSCTFAQLNAPWIPSPDSNTTVGLPVPRQSIWIRLPPILRSRPRAGNSNAAW